MVVAPLSQHHSEQLDLAVSRAMAQWLPDAPDSPEQVIASLERVLLFLRQNGSPSVQARQVTSLALAWGTQVVRGARWRWMSVSEDGSVNPALVSPDGACACLVIDVVTGMVMKQRPASLGGLYRKICAKEWPAPQPGSAIALVE